VLEDGLPNYSLGRGWAQLVEELIPLEISQLFFFDGEKIRSLAEDETSSAALGAAIKALLGLDIVERLIADATVLQTRLARQTGTPEHRTQIEEIERELAELQTQATEAHAERASLENHLQRAETEQHEAEAAFAAGGGRHWEERQGRARRAAELASRAAELEAQLVVLAGGELPLTLVADLLGGVEQQADRESEAAEAEVVQRLLEERDGRLVEELRRGRVSAQTLEIVTEYLARDRQTRLPASPVPRRLALSKEGHSLLGHLRRGELASLCGEAKDLLEKLTRVQEEREELERALAVTPAEEDIARVAERFKTATQKFTLLEEQGRQLTAIVDARQEAVAEARKKLERLWQGSMTKEFEREDHQRMVGLAGRTRETMKEFLHRATARKIDRLSELITELFRFLVRKKTLVERILIDPGTFAVTLYDADGTALPRQRLSEGEKQLFAVAMLWGLARASARPLPTVIDTPMARLDATHRRHLVERYFPNASHQVVILSTDTEVDRHYYHLLQPAVARAYHLHYDEDSRATTGQEGYFWTD